MRRFKTVREARRYRRDAAKDGKAVELFRVERLASGTGQRTRVICATKGNTMKTKKEIKLRVGKRYFVADRLPSIPLTCTYVGVQDGNRMFEILGNPGSGYFFKPGEKLAGVAEYSHAKEKLIEKRAEKFNATA
jgi:hypothetical protein